jgi:hypothetical protein
VVVSTAKLTLARSEAVKVTCQSVGLHFRRMRIALE